MKTLAPIAAVFPVTNALAHPGHGAPELHMHAEWLLVVVAVGLLCWIWKR
jgi:hypothetical protein